MARGTLHSRRSHPDRGLATGLLASNGAGNVAGSFADRRGGTGARRKLRRPDCDGSALGRRSGAWKYWPAVLVLALDLALAPSTLAALTAVLGDLPFTAVAALAPYL